MTRPFLIGALIVVTMLSAPAAFAADPSSPSNLAKQVDDHAKPYVESQYIVGMTVCVIRGDETVICGYGTTGNNDGSTPLGTTIYEIGSISKVFTGLLLADAVVQGRVTLDQSAGELLPSVVKMPDRDGQAITLGQLSTHVSGLPRLPNNMKFADPENPYADYTEELLFQFLDGHSLRRLPGKRMEYSNLGVGLLGALLAREAESSYADLVRNRIANPLGMSDTVIKVDEKNRDRLAIPHTVDGIATKNWDLGALAGAGAIRSTGDDMIRFAGAILDPPEVELSDAIELAWKVQQPAVGKNDFDMGLGWHVARDGATRWHNGQTGGYHSMLMVNRDHDVAVVVLANTATPEVDRLGEDLVRMLVGGEVETRQFEPVALVPAEQLEKLVGHYSLMRFIKFRIRVKEGKLMARLTGQPELRLYAASPTKFKYRAVEAEINFELDEAGNCVALELFQNGVRRTAKRVDE